MSQWEMLDDGSYNGVRKYIRAGTEDDSVDVRHEFLDMSSILDANKETQVDGFDKRSDMWHAAHIPVGVIYEWMRNHGVNFYNPNHREGVKRLLNSSEYRWLRVKNFII